MVIEGARSEKANKEKDALAHRLKALLWDYLPKQRTNPEIPPIDKDSVVQKENEIR